MLQKTQYQHAVKIKSLSNASALQQNRFHVFFNNSNAKLEDNNSFQEIDCLVSHQCYAFRMKNKHYWDDEVVAGKGEINGRSVLTYSQDFTVHDGSLSESNAAKIGKILDMGMKLCIPIMGVNDSVGAHIQEGGSDIFLRNVRASGFVPQITVLCGPSAGGAVHSPALTDWTFMGKQTSNMCLTGLEVVKAVTYEDVNKEDLGGAAVHAKKSGVACGSFENDIEAMASLRQFYDFTVKL